ncbi:MAG: hypothetical protein JWO67_738 [Streptosporangiaceae bacterium]|nr:hypothetical protein [Streptosporangiaceae bacterium]
MPPQLLKYWLPSGEGGAKIRWGESGDYDRCILNIQEAVSKHGAPLGDHTVHGLCATLHKMATGARPGHAPGESSGH